MKLEQHVKIAALSVVIGTMYQKQNSTHRYISSNSQKKKMFV